MVDLTKETNLLPTFCIHKNSVYDIFTLPKTFEVNIYCILQTGIFFTYYTSYHQVLFKFLTIFMEVEKEFLCFCSHEYPMPNVWLCLPTTKTAWIHWWIKFLPCWQYFDVDVVVVPWWKSRQSKYSDNNKKIK